MYCITFKCITWSNSQLKCTRFIYKLCLVFNSECEKYDLLLLFYTYNLIYLLKFDV